MASGPLPRFNPRLPAAGTGLAKPVVMDAKILAHAAAAFLPAVLAFGILGRIFDNRSAVEKGHARNAGEARAARASIGL